MIMFIKTRALELSKRELFAFIVYIGKISIFKLKCKQKTDKFRMYVSKGASKNLGAFAAGEHHASSRRYQQMIQDVVAEFKVIYVPQNCLQH